MSSHSPVPASGLIVFPSRKRASKLPEGLLFSSASACKLSDQHLSEHAALFSAHYGTWGSRGPHPGQRVKMGLQGLRAQVRLTTKPLVVGLIRLGFDELLCSLRLTRGASCRQRASLWTARS